ncbi:hypothetical protein [Methylorubrum sp. GM97]|uniref:hypothetical protein n=1 Tax=Methylorubrum sp. GM97 TaxID=2938232 RepID=UPI00218B8015|nr:hypothetical protein [Methylorubrum sp. GM97]BDL38634.1 hypothetical protein MSPGM_12240 [Methylorubrum sp. GM97]
MLAAIWREAARDDLSIRFVQALPDQLDGLDLGLSGVQRKGFRFGHPIWQRGARSSSASKGQRAYSPATLALRDAIQAWTVIGEQIIRFAFERAQRDGLAFQNRHRNVSASAKGLIGVALGYYPSGGQSWVKVPDRSDLRLVLERYEFQSTHRDGRKTQFVRPGAGRIGRLGPSAPSQAPRYAAMPGQVANQISHDIAAFTDRHPGCDFDPLAIAEWAAKILIQLRIAHSAALSVDRTRSNAGKALRAARTPEDMRRVANGFSLLPSVAIRVLPPFQTCSGERIPRSVGLDDLFGLREAVMLALLADIEPRVINPKLIALERRYADALLETARWLGRLYRERHGVMSLPQAVRLCSLAGPNQLEEDQVTELDEEIKTMMSFLAPEGRVRLWECAAAVVRDGLARSVFVVSPEPTAPTARTSTLARFASKLPDATLSPLPDPIFLPGGYLLVPGDFAQAWQGCCGDLMTSLEEPDEPF